VERRLRAITTERLRCGVVASVPEPRVAIKDHAAHRNSSSKPFVRDAARYRTRRTSPSTGGVVVPALAVNDNASTAE
jgi:hypothetical protein